MSDGQEANDGFSDVILARLNVLNHPLAKVDVGQGPVTGFFRNNFCDASPIDPASHTVAAVLTPTFLEFSASRGNDLRSLFAGLPSSFTASGNCKWCICASRFLEAVKAARTHEQGDRIVPRVILEATHKSALSVVDMADLERFAVGGDGDAEGGGDDGQTSQGASLSNGTGKVKIRPGR